MKKLILFTPILILIFATTLTKDSTKKLDNKISIRVFSDNYKEALKILNKFKLENLIISDSISELEDLIEMSLAKEIFFLRYCTIIY